MYIKVKTRELTCSALDWAVAKCEGWVYDDRKKIKEFQMQQISSAKHCYSTMWAKGGPIIERESIDVFCHGEHWASTLWKKYKSSKEFGHTPLIAAMRCYVASKLGDTVDIPEELI